MSSWRGVRRTLPDSLDESTLTSLSKTEFENPSSKTRRPAVLQSLHAVHIALDTGTEHTKASLLLEYSEGEDDGVPLDSPPTVVWSNCAGSVLSQIAVTRDGRMLWGDEVDQALKKGDINESQVVRHLKPSLFHAHTASQQHFQGGIELTKERKTELSDCLKFYGEVPRDYHLENISVFSYYLGFVYRFVLRFIATSHGSLGWPVFDNLEDYKSWTPPGNPRITVSLPVPVRSSPAQVQLMVAAAKAAGIPNPYPVAEPAAAMIYHLYKARGQSLVGKTFLILDIGAGSADQQIWTVVNENPLRLREHIIPEESKIAWCGGAYTNEVAVKLIKDRFRNKDRVFEGLQRNRSSITDERELERKLYQRFEKEKKRFEGRDALCLCIQGLPDIPEYGLQGGGKVVLEAGDVRRAFAPCLDQIINMLDISIRSVVEGRSLRGRTVEQRVHEIIVVGGCSQNRYLLDQIRDRYSGGVQSPVSYVIPVTLPPHAAQGSLTVARGAVLLSAEKKLIKERYVRRSFCAEWHIEISQDEQKNYRRSCLYKSPHDLQLRACVTKFLLRRGLHPQKFSCPPLNGWRGLMLRDKAAGGWWVKEQLYYSDKTSEDGVCTKDPRYEIKPMASPLIFRISFEEAQQFPRRVNQQGQVWWELEYELILSVDGHIMTFEFIIPRTGKWPTDGDRYVDVMWKTGQYDTAGVSQLFGASQD
ncbi:hypothetical protein AYL99_00216 [Fonsecaea erecta]|uniref:Actin-like ATPase domain-containing protein n=1 Tax=Fonsecaea erecta TaxID=1367422 RepID=A0A178ZWT6_9EURO|nr:hypothetical protein AYL99_00216 [Fonsecaea erecta]OAP64244.1 hypothetical protein AYL99_00216 [Fonsecaea erecta]